MGIINAQFAPAVLGDKTKGNMANRTECMVELSKNNLGTNVALVATGVTAAIVHDKAAVQKAFPQLTQFVNKIANKVTGNNVFKTVSEKIGNVLPKVKGGAVDIGSKLASKFPKLGELVKSGISSVKKNPKMAGLIALGTVAVGLILNHSHKAGRIEQKYEDKAKFEKVTK